MKFQSLKFILILIVAAVLSIPLAILSEGTSLQNCIGDCTPGLFVSHLFVPPNNTQDLSSLGKDLEIAVAVDAPLWFLLICGTAFIIVKRRRRLRKPNER